MTNRYPTVPLANCSKIVQEFLTEGPRGLRESEVSLTGTGPELDLTNLASRAEDIEVARQVFADSDSASDRDLFEGQACGHLHKTLRDVPIQILDDPGFWRYVALEHLWPLTYWREQETFDRGVPAKYMLYVDGMRTSECVVTRMYLRAHACVIDGDYSLAQIPKGTDFWRSHVLRVSVGAAPTVTQAFAREQLDNRMPSSELRPYARRLNRYATNVVLPLLTDEDAARLVSDLRAS